MNNHLNHLKGNVVGFLRSPLAEPYDCRFYVSAECRREISSMPYISNTVYGKGGGGGSSELRVVVAFLFDSPIVFG